MKRILFLILGLSLILSACGSKPAAVPTPTPAPTPTSVFNYDATMPFDPKVISETERDGVTVVDLTYAAHDPAFAMSLGGRTLAYLVKPHGQGPFAGMIYLHWMGTYNQTGSNRKQFLDEAVAMAKHGTVCLLIQGVYPWMSPPLGSQNDRAGIIGQEAELRRAVDFLLAQPGVDPRRIGFAGHDYGAMYGAILAGLDPRVKSYVLIAGWPDFTDAFRASIFVGIDPATYPDLVRDLDPVGYLPKAASSSFLFQFGKRDAMVSKDQADQLAEAVGRSGKVVWYDELHQMDGPTVRQDRLDWLADQLGLEAFQP